ncbi:unannotated protein [freshwater metagenome]|uniref:Unannotated protein n=1 Tax=freshwater metagenome TaxID=449393 RepID=A0A6J6HTK9_9ZZZZ
MTRVTGVANNLFAVAFVAPKILVWSIKVVTDYRVRCLENVVGGTVVLFKQNGFCTVEVFFKFNYVTDVRAAKGIDRLIAIANHG